MALRLPNAQDEERFKYSPLHDDAIRLVKLHPAPFHEPITCTLSQTKLDSSLKYEALSYTWGNHQNIVYIEVDGRRFGVTHNLGTALRYLRRKREITLWIDALCIDQTNDKERTKQVALMTRIYRQAQSVQIWLGPAANDSEMVMELFKNFAKDPMRLVDESRSRALRTKILARTRSILQNLVSRPAVEAYTSSREIDWLPGEADRPSLEMDRSPFEGNWSSGEEILSEVSDLSEELEPMGEPTGEAQWLKNNLMHEEQVRLRRALDALLEQEYWYRAWVIQEIVSADKISLKCGLGSAWWEPVTALLKAFMDEEFRRLRRSGSRQSDFSSIQELRTWLALRLSYIWLQSASVSVLQEDPGGYLKCS